MMILATAEKVELNAHGYATEGLKIIFLWNCT